MAIADLIDMERLCSNPECKHKRGAHGGTYYKRDCGVINCVCREFAEIRYTRNNSTWDGLVNEANRLDNANKVWEIRQKQTEDANKELRARNARLTEELKSQANSELNIELANNRLSQENQVLREELAKCQEVLELLHQANKLPKHIGAWLLGDRPEIEEIVDDFSGEYEFAAPDC